MSTNEGIKSPAPGCPLTAMAIGADIKALRQTQDFSIVQLAKRINRSVGWLSQVERGLSLPNLADIRAISRALNVRVSLFFGLHEETVLSEDERGIIVRKGSRRTLGHESDGCTEELLSPNGEGALQVVRCALRPSAQIATLTPRGQQEMVVVVAGKIDIEIDGRSYTLNAGDTLTCHGQAHVSYNRYKCIAVLHWIITPPAY